MRLTLLRVQWLALFSELEPEQQTEALQIMRDRYASEVEARIHDLTTHMQSED